MVDCQAIEGQLVDAWIQGNFTDAVVCPYDLQVGALTFGLFVYGSVTMGLYIRTGSALIPLLITIIGGTVAVSRLPSGAMQILVIGLLLVLTVAAYYLYQRAQTTA